jgi:periplasmic divalent cation tolerance protein
VPEIEYRLVLSTCADGEAARRIAEALVGEDLAACVNVIPAVQSIYKWRGKVESATEHQLLIKTTTMRYPRLQTRLRELHPYELPEIVAVPIVDGLPDYLSWLNQPE